MGTTWKPDTCNCVISIEDEGVLLFVEACPFHTTPEDVIAENRAKNLEIVNPLIEEFGAGETLPKGKSIEWERNESGTLDYKLIGFTAEEQLQALSVVDSKDAVLKDESSSVLVAEPVLEAIKLG